MKSSARLGSAIFQLTPTRTRFDLVITANGKTERIASGLLNPFLAHLKSAQEQIGRGGYSIVLEPNRGSDASWFTKGTVERFVRFVSTPEILERVYKIESEISQIEEAISLQRKNSTAEMRGVQDQVKNKESSEPNSRKSNNHDNARKSGSKITKLNNEEKAIVLYKPDALTPETEGFNMQGENSRTQLLRVLETRKGVLQKEQGMAFARAMAAGFDIDHIVPLLSFSECFGATRMMEACSRFVDLWKAKHESGQWVEAVEALKEPWVQDEMSSENKDLKTHIGNHLPPLMPEHHVDQFHQKPVHPHHSIHPHWPVHPQASQMPVYQPYPLPMPYYQNYPGSGTSFHGSDMSSCQKLKQRDHSVNNEELHTESAIYHGSDIEENSQRIHHARKKGGKNARKQSGRVVIRNINYIASKEQQSSDSGSQMSTTSEDDDNDDIKAINKNLKRSKQERNGKRSGDAFKKLNEEDNGSARTGDDGHWQAFQTLLLRNADDNDNLVKGGMFAMEERALGRRQPAVFGNDPSIIGRHQNDLDINNYRDTSGDMTRKLQPSPDGMLMGKGVGADSADTHLGLQFSEMGGETNAYMQTATGMVDESFIVPCRSRSIEQVGGNGRITAYMDSELHLERADSVNLAGNYEPYDLNIMPNRDIANGRVNFDPAMDYELQAAKVDGSRKSVDVKKRTKKIDNAQELKSQKKPTALSKRGMPPKLSPAEEARARAERLRSYKADLQKQKKAKEEEQLKRLEALKIERQKRIAARNSSGSTAARSPLPSPQAKKPMPKKLSPVSQKGSRFSDTEPGSASPLQRSTVKTISRLSGDAHKTSRPGRLDFSGLSGGNRLTRSASPLTGRKEESNPSTPPGAMAPVAKIRRLSEPKVSYPVTSIASLSEKSKSFSRRTSKGPVLKKTSSIIKSTALPEPESGENRITRSVSSLSDRKEEKNVSKPDPKMSLARIRRLSEPKSSSYLAPSLTPLNEKPLSIRTSKGSEINQSSVVVKSEIIKSVAIPEITNKDSNALFEVSKKRCVVKEPIQKRSTFSSSLIGDSNQISPKNDYDEKTVVEKTVVMLECEKSPPAQTSDGRTHVQSIRPVFNDTKGKCSQAVPISAQSSASEVKEINGKVIDHQLRKASPSSKVGATYPEKVLPNSASTNVTEKPYNAPYARVSSLEHPSTEKSEYAKAPPTTSETTTAAGTEVTTARVSSSTVTVNVSDDRMHKLDKIWEVSENPPEKEPSKGFKRLLKFGRKKHGSGSDYHLELDHQSNRDEPNVASSGEEYDPQPTAFTLKELISQGERSTAQTTPQKSSRSFSLLSPFRSKAAQHKTVASNKTEGL